MPFLPVLAVLFTAFNLTPSIENRRLPGWRLKVCGDGCELLILFLISTSFSVVAEIFVLSKWFSQDKWLCFWNLIFIIVVKALVFWNGIIRVYATSIQLGMKWRVMGILCGWILVAHLVALWKIIHVVSFEVRLESEKIWKNRERKAQGICRTKYPLLMVHGVFFRDFKYFNYWGRIPGQLEENGAKIFYGNHQSAASEADSGKELAERILEILKETGCEKVNVIAHSKGGLDTRYALSHLHMDKYVASLTTINTPHLGCVFADYLLDKIPDGVEEKVAETSFPWGAKYRFLTTKGRRGISHGDMVDLNRENIRDFDVREFYVELVQELKNMGF